MDASSSSKNNLRYIDLMARLRATIFALFTSLKPYLRYLTAPIWFRTYSTKETSRRAIALCPGYRDENGFRLFLEQDGSCFTASEIPGPGIQFFIREEGTYMAATAWERFPLAEVIRSLGESIGAGIKKKQEHIRALAKRAGTQFSPITPLG